MSSNNHKTIYRKDYQPSSFLIEDISLIFKLDAERTQVTSSSKYYRNPIVQDRSDQLVLDGEDLKLIDISIDGKILEKGQFRQNEKSLVLFNPPDEFTLQITTEINPQENKALNGLYLTSDNYCTQCEAEGFRRITYYLDRPDILAIYTTRIENYYCY